MTRYEAGLREHDWQHHNRERKNLFVETIEFNNHKTGICSFKKGTGLYTCNSWESEDKLEHISAITKHFQTFFQNGFEGSEFAEKIVSNVLEKIEDSYLKNTAKTFIENSNSDITFQAEKYISI